jgi:hypothetical protein
MKLGIMQPYFFPYLGYFQGIYAVDKYILYDNLAYIKDGWMNRNRLLVVKGKPTYFIVEIKRKSSNKKISEIEVVDGIFWRQKILKSIFYNYRNRPFFEEIYPLIERVINSDVKFLSELNFYSIIVVSNYLDIKTNITTDTSKYLELENKLSCERADLFSLFPSIKLNKPERKVVRAIEICRSEGANIFINAIGGQTLYDKAEFLRNNIKILFVKTNKYSYQQSTAEFHPNLSIIDVLMNCGKDGTKKLLNEYTLI